MFHKEYFRQLMTMFFG